MTITMTLRRTEQTLGNNERNNMGQVVVTGISERGLT